MATKAYKARNIRLGEFCEYALMRVMSGNQWFTSHNLAKSQGMKPSTHLREMLALLVEEGILTTKIVPHRYDKQGNVIAQKLMYRLSDETQKRWSLL